MKRFLIFPAAGFRSALCFDRHNGNWGILIDEQKQTAEIAPVYDCGSCLYPQLGVEQMEKVLNSEEEINHRIFVFPTSEIMENGKKISYFDFISSLQNEECNRALKKIVRRINMEEINKLIEDTPDINSLIFVLLALSIHCFNISGLFR